MYNPAELYEIRIRDWLRELGSDSSIRATERHRDEIH